MFLHQCEWPSFAPIKKQHGTTWFIVAVNSNIKWPVSHRRWAIQLRTMAATILRVVKPRTSSHSPNPVSRLSDWIAACVCCVAKTTCTMLLCQALLRGVSSRRGRRSTTLDPRTGLVRKRH
jgi:hypothetical protein